MRGVSDIERVDMGESTSVTAAIGAFSLGFHHTGRGPKFGGCGDNWDPTGRLIPASWWGSIACVVDALENEQPRTDSASAILRWIETPKARPRDLDDLSD